MSRPVWARINLDALHHNLQQIRSLASGVSVMAVIKADAYGHGAVTVAREIQSAVEGFGVAGVDEAINLVQAGINRDVYLLSGFHDKSEIDQVCQHGLVPVLHSWHQVEQLEASNIRNKLRTWVKFDSGMHRIGFHPEEVGRVVRRLQRIPNVVHSGLISHLACADEQDSPETGNQIEVFSALAADYTCDKSLANSAGIAAWSRSHFDWVRPGIMLYGCTPVLASAEHELGLRPVMTLCSRVIAVKQLRRGDSIGYGGTWHCPEDMPVAVITCGYGDGYPRHAPSGTPVWIRGRRAALVGRVSMDLITLDVRGIDSVKVGDEVELWGEHVTASEVAASAGTISYEVLTGVTARVPRVEVRSGKA